MKLYLIMDVEGCTFWVCESCNIDLDGDFEVLDRKTAVGGDECARCGAVEEDWV